MYQNKKRYALTNGIILDGTCGMVPQRGRTIYKAAIPWSEIIGRGTVKSGDSFRFTMLANDNDGAGRRGWAQLTDGIAGQKNPDWFGIIELKK